MDKAHEILVQIKKFFDEGNVVSGSALLFDDDRTLSQHIDEVLEPESPQAEMTVAVRKKKKIAKNYYGNWVGFEGKRKVRDFGKSEESALDWLWSE